MGVLCKHCSAPILFGLDRSDGHGPINPWVKLVLTCGDSVCSEQDDYSGATVSRFQKSDVPMALESEATA